MNPRPKREIVAALASIRGGQYCAYCNKRLSYKEITIDHILPVFRGGTWETENLCMSCLECNNGRGHNTSIQPLYRERGPDVQRNKSTFYTIGKELEKAISKNTEFSFLKKEETKQVSQKEKPKPQCAPSTKNQLFSISDLWPKDYA